MRVRCIYSSYKDVVPPLDPDEYSYTSILQLIPGKEYIVYGLSALKKDGKILYDIVVDETGEPDSYISDLFEIVDSQLPLADWHFGLGTEQHAVSFILIGIHFNQVNPGILQYIVGIYCVSALHLVVG